MSAPFVRESLRDGQVLCYRFYEMSNGVMDEWGRDAITLIRTWPNHKPLLSLIDIHMGSPIVSAQVLLRAREVATTRPELFGRTAILIASPAGAQVFNGLLRTMLPLGVRQRRLFADETRALDWLLELIRR